MRVPLQNCAEGSRLGNEGPLLLHSSPSGKSFIPKSIENAWPTENPYVGIKSRGSLAQRVGLAYERKVLKIFGAPGCDLGGWTLVCGPWFGYSSRDDRRRYCQPDFLLQSAKEPLRVVIGEIKVRWTADAWWQLRRLYQPVLERAGRQVAGVVCVCRSFDPAIKVEEEVNFVDGPLVENGLFNVLVVR